MIIKNGEKLEGFFSSYEDGSHRIVPMKCILVKKSIGIHEGTTED